MKKSLLCFSLLLLFPFFFSPIVFSSEFQQKKCQHNFKTCWSKFALFEYEKINQPFWERHVFILAILKALFPPKSFYQKSTNLNHMYKKAAYLTFTQKCFWKFTLWTFFPLTLKPFLIHFLLQNMIKSLKNSW